MNQKTIANELYFVVMPQISLSAESYGKVDHFLTLLPDRKMASEFSDHDVKVYMSIFKNREKYFVGNGVIGYEYEKIPMPSGRFIVKVIQNVE
jgi:hypothetical protein